MRIMTAGAAAALLVASAFGVMALPSSQPATPVTGTTLVQAVSPQPSAAPHKAKKKASKASTRKSAAYHRKGRKSALHHTHRNKTAKYSAKRASAKPSMHKGASKQRAS